MPKYSQVVNNVGDETVYRRAPSMGLAAVLMALFYILVLIAFLKILKIIPDPPEVFDLTSLVINVAMAVGGAAVTNLYRYFRNLQTRFTTLETSVNKLNEDMQNKFKDLNMEIKHLRDYMDLTTRIARLESRKE